MSDEHLKFLYIPKTLESSVGTADETESSSELTAWQKRHIKLILKRGPWSKKYKFDHS